MTTHHKKNVVAILGARGGSKGLPGKNIHPFLGKPLIYWTIKALQDAKIIDRIIVSTDDDKIAAVAKQYGCEVPFIRPEDLSGDFATTESMLKHAVDWLEEHEKYHVDIVVFVQLTDIFRHKGMLQTVVQWLLDDDKLESAFVAYPTHKKYWEQNDDGTYRRITSGIYGARQKAKPVYREDTGIACATRASIIKRGDRLGTNVKILANKDENSVIDIHSADDIWLAEIVARHEMKKPDCPYYFEEP